jgi:uncharacterized protein YceH (UPF0502 family)
MPAVRSLDPIEQRVVGCLVEKELSTPDVYPLTLNALVAACNQTSNREPVSRLSPGDVEAALLRLMADLLVWRDRGARALRWKHSLDEKLALREPAPKAVLAELLLRGAQTPGELRSRTPRMHEFAELAEVEETLRALAARGLVEELPRQPGQKERRWRHLLGSGEVPEAVAPPRTGLAVEPRHGERDTSPQPPRAAAVVEAARPTTARGGEGGIEARLAALERRVEELAAAILAIEDRGR